MTAAVAGEGHVHPARGEHRALGHGGLRAAVFGASDGLVSNAALILGVSAGTSTGAVVVLAGVAGWLAGAFSMAVGEWISVKAQREALEEELRKEEEHLVRYPSEEREHMREVLRRAGLGEEAILAVTADLEQDPRLSLDFHARLELGIDPDEMGSPMVAALASFASFTLGAVVPLLPWLALAGPVAFRASLVLSLLSMFGVGAFLARFTRRPWAWSGLRQLLLGGVAVAVTMAIGSFFGVGGGG